MSLLFQFSTFFTIIGLFDTMFDEDMSNNIHVFFIPCLPCENIIPVWENIIPVCPGTLSD